MLDLIQNSKVNSNFPCPAKKAKIWPMGSPCLVLTIHKHFELLVIELCFFLRNESTFGALAHGINKAHTRKRHFLAAAFVTKTLSASPAVVLGGGQGETKEKLYQQSRSFVLKPMALAYD